MRLELTRVGLLAELANHYTTRGALHNPMFDSENLIKNVSRLLHKFFQNSTDLSR